MRLVVAMGRVEVNEKLEAYGSFRYSSINVTQQVAPSGIFGFNFFTNLNNPFIGNSARNTILAAANAGVAANTVCADVTCGGANTDPDSPSFVNWRDTNGDGLLSQEEMQPNGDRAARMFDRLDDNGDGQISEEEFASMKKGKRKGGRDGDAETENN